MGPIIDNLKVRSKNGPKLKLKSWKVPTSCHSAGSAINVCRVDEDANNYTMTGTNAKLTPIPQIVVVATSPSIYSMLTYICACGIQPTMEGQLTYFYFK